MNKREKILLDILIILSVICFFYLTFNYSLTSIKESKEGIKKYSAAIEKLQQNQTSNNIEIIESDELPDDFSTSEIADMILTNLRTFGIIPQKYQIVTSSKGTYIDALLKCTGKQFASYVCSIEERTYPYTIANITEKTEADSITATIRYTLVPSKISKSNDKTDKNRISNLFRPIYKPKLVEKHEEIIENQKEEKTEIIEDGNINYRIIGNIVEGDGEMYLYLKKVDTNRVYKLTEEDIIESTDSEYVLQIDDKKIRIERGK